MAYFLFNIHDVVLIVTVVECLLLAAFQSILPNRSSHDGRLLIVFFLIAATASGSTLIFWSDYLTLAHWAEQTLAPYLLLIAVLLKGPAIYLYVCSLTRQNFSFNPVKTFHLVPAVLVVLCLTFFNISANDLRYIPAQEPVPPKEAINFAWNLAALTPFMYAVAALRQIRRYRRELRNEYSHYSEAGILWLNILMWSVCVSWAWTATAHIVAKISSDYIADYMGIIDNYLSFFLTNGFFAYSLTCAHQLLATQPKEETERSTSEAKNEPSELAIEKVRNAMEVDKLYLRKNLNLEQLAGRIDVPEKDISLVINKHFGTNFFEFVNSYRVEAAKTLLSDPAKYEMTVLDVLLDSGFNSKSAFHRFFNRLVGMSPTEYRAKSLSGKLCEAK